jgi:hypothetical protein
VTTDLETNVEPVIAPATARRIILEYRDHAFFYAATQAGNAVERDDLEGGSFWLRVMAIIGEASGTRLMECNADRA